MNVTELARALRISPQELRDLLPQMGFNIGQKAIKVDKATAKRIIREWPTLIRQVREKRAAEELLNKKEAIEQMGEKKVISIPHFITVRDFAALAQLPVNKILAELMKSGIFVSINEKIDFDTASIIGADLYLDIRLAKEEQDELENPGDKKLTHILEKEIEADLQERPPVIVVMGHVDHGKTKLLDAIRKANVMEGEAGGITQHIGAYQVRRKDRLLTFIDTPGHEAFTAMRSRGAKVADIAILVVAADDGVKPQTVEAFRIIEAAKIPYIVAINKIDKPDADVNRTKQELSTQLGITPEDWGGKIICVPISAREATGIEELLDMLLLVSEAESGSLRANPVSAAVGTVVEARIDKGAGPIATILVQNGNLKIGDQLCFNNIIFGKVKAMKNYKGELIEAAGPSTPVRILGLKSLPEVGDMLEVGEGERVKAKRTSSSLIIDRPAMKVDESDDAAVKLNLIIKSDVLGSAEAIEESLMKINTDKIKVKIISRGLGNINEGDIKRAEDSAAQIVGFHVRIQPAAETIVREKNIKVNLFSVIYDLIKYVKAEMQVLVKPDFIRHDIGRLKVLAVFRTENAYQIVGGKVLDGRIENGASAELERDKAIITSGKLSRLQSGKQNINSAEKDQECGLQFEGQPIIQVGDILNIYKEEEVINKL